jgi:hypothetical protein
LVREDLQKKRRSLGVAGQLRYERIGSDVLVFADINGDGIADLQIILPNGPDLAFRDFFI